MEIFIHSLIPTQEAMHALGINMRFLGSVYRRFLLGEKDQLEVAERILIEVLLKLLDSHLSNSAGLGHSPQLSSHSGQLTLRSAQITWGHLTSTPPLVLSSALGFLCPPLLTPQMVARAFRSLLFEKWRKVDPSHSASGNASAIETAALKVAANEVNNLLGFRFDPLLSSLRSFHLKTHNLTEVTLNLTEVLS